MAKRRGHGEGSIYRRKDGRWAASLTVAYGTRKYFYGATQKEVQEKLRQAQRELDQGTLVTGPQQTVKQFLEQWVENTYQPTVKLLSYIQARSMIKTHLVPELGQVMLQKLTPDMLQALYRRKIDEGKKPSTVQIIHKVLRRALVDAVKWGLVARNVASLVTPPRVETHEVQALTVEQAKKLLACAKGSFLSALFVLALTTGMRRGELLALRWSDVDFEQATVFVHRTVTRAAGYGLVENEPKTKASRRRIMLSAIAVEALKTHREEQGHVKTTAGERWQEKGVIFCDTKGNFLGPDKLAGEFNRLLQQAGLPHMRFHDLRHSAATISLVAGVHPKVVQERLGHSSISMTLDTYSHVLPSMQQDAARKIDDLFT
ncbi:MAG TPA: site-specific integrase [Ktedonobacteraceae bacterium]|nr:site-specific integrase [Ktedonobacteraceae bacterium]